MKGAGPAGPAPSDGLGTVPPGELRTEVLPFSHCKYAFPYYA